MSSATRSLGGTFPVDALMSATVAPASVRRHSAGNPNTRRDGDRRCAPHRDEGGCRPPRRNARGDRCRHVRRRGYPSDLTESQWQRLQPLLCGGRHIRRSRSTVVRAVLNAISYRWRCGCTWRMLPHDFPPWETVYGYYRNWRNAGILPVIRDALLRRCALESGRQPKVDTR